MDSIYDLRALERFFEKRGYPAKQLRLIRVALFREGATLQRSIRHLSEEIRQAVRNHFDLTPLNLLDRFDSICFAAPVFYHVTHFLFT